MSARLDTTFEQAESKLAELEAQVRDLVSRREAGLRRAKDLDGTGAQVAGLRGLNTPLDEIGRFQFLHFVTGSLPEGFAAHPDLGFGPAAIAAAGS